MQLRNEKAVLTAQLKLLRGSLAAQAKKESSAARATVATESKLKASLTRGMGEASAAVAAAERRVQAAEDAAASAEARADAAEGRALAAEEAAEAACAEAAAEAEMRAEARKTADDAKYLAKLAELRAERASQRAELAEEELRPFRAGACADRTADEWEALSREARWKASQRERAWLKTLLKVHSWRMEDMASVLSELGWVEPLFKTKEVFDEYFKRVAALVDRIEHQDYGTQFGMFLHYDLNLTLDKILRLTQSGCKDFNAKINRYQSRPLLFHPFRKNEVINVPRIAPPVSKMLVIKRAIESKLGVTSSDDGRMARVDFKDVVQQLLAQDPGHQDMPRLEVFLGPRPAVPLPLIISYDATGFGQQQFNTIALHNPHMSQCAAAVPLPKTAPPPCRTAPLRSSPCRVSTCSCPAALRAHPTPGSPREPQRFARC
eukprot:2792216-Prymnesium_polylepis.2